MLAMIKYTLILIMTFLYIYNNNRFNETCILLNLEFYV